MNGTAVRVPRTDAFRTQHDALVTMSQDWSVLDEWARSEAQRLADSQGWTGDRQVVLRVWQQRLPASWEASMNAYARFTGVNVGDPASPPPVADTRHPRH